MVTPRAALKLTAFRLSDLDIALLGEVQRREGLVTAASAFRHLLRRYAKAEGIDLDTLTSAPTTAPASPVRKGTTKAKRRTTKD